MSIFDICHHIIYLQAPGYVWILDIEQVLIVSPCRVKMWTVGAFSPPIHLVTAADQSLQVPTSRCRHFLSAPTSRPLLVLTLSCFQQPELPASSVLFPSPTHGHFTPSSLVSLYYPPPHHFTHSFQFLRIHEHIYGIIHRFFLLINLLFRLDRSSFGFGSGSGLFSVFLFHSRFVSPPAHLF